MLSLLNKSKNAVSNSINSLIGNKNKNEDVSDDSSILSFSSDSVEEELNNTGLNQSNSSTFNKNSSDIEEFSIKELKKITKELNISNKGTREQLIKRIKTNKKRQRRNQRLVKVFPDIIDFGIIRLIIEYLLYSRKYQGFSIGKFYFNLKEIINYSLVCKKWNKVCSDTISNCIELNIGQWFKVDINSDSPTYQQKILNLPIGKLIKYHFINQINSSISEYTNNNQIVNNDSSNNNSFFNNSNNFNNVNINNSNDKNNNLNITLKSPKINTTNSLIKIDIQLLNHYFDLSTTSSSINNIHTNNNNKLQKNKIINLITEQTLKKLWEYEREISDNVHYNVRLYTNHSNNDSIIYLKQDPTCELKIENLYIDMEHKQNEDDDFKAISKLKPKNLKCFLWRFNNSNQDLTYHVNYSPLFKMNCSMIQSIEIGGDHVDPYIVSMVKNLPMLHTLTISLLFHDLMRYFSGDINNGRVNTGVHQFGNRGFYTYENGCGRQHGGGLMESEEWSIDRGWYEMIESLSDHKSLLNLTLINRCSRGIHCHKFQEIPAMVTSSLNSFLSRNKSITYLNLHNWDFISDRTLLDSFSSSNNSTIKTLVLKEIDYINNLKYHNDLNFNQKLPKIQLFPINLVSEIKHLKLRYNNTLLNSTNIINQLFCTNDSESPLPSSLVSSEIPYLNTQNIYSLEIPFDISQLEHFVKFITHPNNNIKEFTLVLQQSLQQQSKSKNIEIMIKKYQNQIDNHPLYKPHKKKKIINFIIQ
ncbi:hypothetical protein DICPUDRAFT_74430 [Dictyostelium purpureum]|uniref:SAP domain-containing protein n=1 Tax=Dictyostelium purpureum TaxID=5786 RepID=F0Z7Q4_DICPU|nr:uncharacterized protein DICPUDRAFT_74430 [Dictyostelium purpureum]EGC40057.1 hypothetical protein DICPUDRAFT_74430 [Dictyostelium purpureum]|eukprot:XP_003283406.1 hypothetical protein DICPUDRAFT_74430 [Dictyostelium purpureum]